MLAGTQDLVLQIFGQHFRPKHSLSSLHFGLHVVILLDKGQFTTNKSNVVAKMPRELYLKKVRHWSRYCFEEIEFLYRGAVEKNS